jgi:hypothetical protein
MKKRTKTTTVVTEKALPKDLKHFRGDQASTWARLEQAESVNLADKMDFIGHLVFLERASGEKAYVQNVAAKIGATRKAVENYNGMFKLFRAAGGLELTREFLCGITATRLRSLATRANQWSIANPGEAKKLLKSDLGEEDIVRYVKNRQRGLDGSSDVGRGYLGLKVTKEERLFILNALSAYPFNNQDRKLPQGFLLTQYFIQLIKDRQKVQPKPKQPRRAPKSIHSRPTTDKIRAQS